MDTSFKSVEEALEYIKPFEDWRNYSAAFEKYIDGNLENYKSQHAEEYVKIKNDVIKYLTGEGVTEIETNKAGKKVYKHFNADVFALLSTCLLLQFQP